MSNTETRDEMEAGIAAIKAEKFMKISAKVEPGKLFAVRCGWDNKRAQTFIKRLGGQFEPKSKLWVIRADARNMDCYLELIQPGITALSGAEYKAAYDAARA
jgi:hypothetical protein